MIPLICTKQHSLAGVASISRDMIILFCLPKCPPCLVTSDLPCMNWTIHSISGLLIIPNLQHREAA